MTDVIIAHDERIEEALAAALAPLPLASLVSGGFPFTSPSRWDTRP